MEQEKIDKKTSAGLTDVDALRATLCRLSDDGVLEQKQRDEIAVALPAALDSGAYVLRHLAVHLGIGGVRTVLMIPFPVGSILRPLWVAAWRVYETVRRRPERAAVHSVIVFLFAILPVIGYLAYLISLRRVDESLAFVMVNHLCYKRRDCHYQQWYAQRSILMRKLLQTTIPAAVPEKINTR